MYQLIASNKRRSFLLVFVFSALVLSLGYLLAVTVEGGEAIFIGVLLFTIISVLTSYYAGDKIVLASTGAKRIEKADDPDLFTTVENLAITAGVPMPAVYIIPDMGLNAFATGRDPEHASVAITHGLRQVLDKSELEAVMGHELSHVKNYDTRLMVLTAVLFGMVVLIADLLWRLSFGGRDRKRSTPILLVLIVIAAILAPIAAQLIKFAISRRREYLADASSVMLTRYPDAMVSALQKISQAPMIAGHHEATAHLFIYSPLNTSFTQRLFSTHPPLEERIAAIREAARLRT